MDFHHHVSWAEAELCSVTESSALGNCHQNIPTLGCQADEGCFHAMAREESTWLSRFGVPSAVRCGGCRVSGREHRGQPGGFPTGMGLFFLFPSTGRDWDCSSVRYNVLVWVFLSGECHVLFSGSCFELSSALTCHKQQRICSEPGLLLGKAKGKQLLWWVLEQNTQLFYWPGCLWPLASAVFHSLWFF